MGPMVHMEHGTTVNGSLQQCGWADVVLAFLIDGTGQPLRPMDTLCMEALTIEIFVFTQRPHKDFDVFFRTFPKVPQGIAWKLMRSR